ncbi:MAG: 50S ribosome-binding GTPase [Candidatus Aenigmarchaeota archaeon]|nr:50S ribosome-binding GTPase [Candidatus Aenigmarchaeota archaeon]
MVEKYKKRVYWDVVNDVIKEADIVLEVLDARFVEQTRNKEIEDKVKRLNKPLIYVLNKCDLIEKEEAEKQKKKFENCIFMSATKKYGSTMLLHEILRQSKVGSKIGRIIVGVLGYPNTGKSSVINVLVGRQSAKTSPVSGFTSGLQMIKITKNIYLMDTPGVIPYKEEDAVKHMLIASKNPSDIQNIHSAAVELIKMAKGRIEEHYGVEKGTPDSVLKRIAIKYNRVKKGGVPDTEVVARKMIQDWQRGKIRV